MSDTVRVSEPLLRLGLMPFAAATVSAPSMLNVSFMPFSPWKTSLPAWQARFSLMPWGPLTVRSSEQVRTVKPYDGAFTVSGTVTKYNLPTNLPLRRRVRLLQQLTGFVIRETWSDNGGNYVFDFVANVPCTIVVYDHEKVYRAVVADNVTPVPR